VLGQVSILEILIDFCLDLWDEAAQIAVGKPDFLL